MSVEIPSSRHEMSRRARCEKGANEKSVRFEERCESDGLQRMKMVDRNDGVRG